MKNDAGVLAAAARTLERMRTYVNAVAPPEERAAIFHDLARLPVERLAAMNPAEAEHVTEGMLLRARGAAAQGPGANSTVVCASRGSALALTQTRMVASRLARRGIATTILNVTTSGDRIQDRSLAAIGTQSLFVKELELALREGRADYAVHSCKDLPSSIPDDMLIAAISAREDPRDAFCSEKFPDFFSLPRGARVGTSSPRRRAQLCALRADLQYDDVRGNIDTRLNKLRDAQYDAIVLACAGMLRLGVSARYTVPFEVDAVVPAPAQGSLAIETRADAHALAGELRAAVNDDASERAAMCERAALRTLQGGCQAPIGIHARFEGGDLRVDAVVADAGGSTVLRETLRGPAQNVAQAQALGVRIANALLDRGAKELAAPKEAL